jgi:fumarate hydratase subunit alpha
LREVHCDEIKETVARLAVQACYELPDDVLQALRAARSAETSPVGQAVLGQIVENAEIARLGEYPLCQDTGYALIFLDLGQDVHVVGGNLADCVTAGVGQGYRDGYLRKSVVSHPYASRVNTRDNTPPVIHTSIVPGDRIRIAVLPKGAGSENMSHLAMLVPAEGRQGIVGCVIDVVDKAGANPCPPLIVGVGIGGTAEQAVLLSKRALLRPVGTPSPDPDDVLLEAELLERINALGIGPAGLGGRVTALAVHVVSQACHIASLPVGITLQCHSARHQVAVI